MTYQYKLTPLAVLDINDALDYISDKLRNPGAAKISIARSKKRSPLSVTIPSHFRTAPIT
jgi:hypothetical protein